MPTEELFPTTNEASRQEVRDLVAEFPLPEAPLASSLTPTILSSRAARKVTQDNLQQLNQLRQRFLVRPQIEQQAVQQPAAPQQPETPENALTPQEAQELFNGDFSQLQFDEATNAFTPRDERQQKRIKALRLVDRQQQDIDSRLQSLASTADDAQREMLTALMVGYRRRAETVKRLFS